MDFQVAPLYPSPSIYRALNVPGEKNIGVSEAWIAFARASDPNTPTLFNNKSRPTMIFDDFFRVVDDPSKEQRIAMFQALNLDR